MLKVSIVTPCFNDGQYLKDAVESTASSRESGFCEHIVVDDGSTDTETLKFYEELPALGVKLIYAGKVGLGKARNIGIRAASAAYYLNLDADNKIRPEFPLEAAGILDENPGIGIVYGDAQFFGREVKVYRPGPYNLQKLLWHNYIDTCSLIRKKTWEDAGGYDEKEMLWEDWNFWLSIHATSWGFKYVQKIWYDYRIREESSLRETHLTRGKEVDNYIAKKYSHLYRQGYKDLTSANNKLEEQIEELNKTIKNKEQKIRRLKKNHEKERITWIDRATLFREMQIEAENQLRQARWVQRNMENSLSWKVTSPFRYLSNIFRKKT